MSASIFFSLAFAHFLAVISPGPDFFYVVKTSIQKRLSYALIASFAIGFGVFLHSMFSVYAFRILYQIIPNLYVFIGSLGGMYLLYLGLSGLRNNVFSTNIICEKAMEKGVFSICTGRGTLKLGPPLTIPKSALIEGLNVYEECLKKML